MEDIAKEDAIPQSAQPGPTKEEREKTDQDEAMNHLQQALQQLQTQMFMINSLM